MTWINAACRDPKCKGPNGCYNRGPQGQWCYFDTEIKLCQVLNILYDGQSLDSLLALVRDRLESKAVKSDYDLAIEKAQTALTKPNLEVETLNDYPKLP
jgi:hypothetical protein